MKNVWVVVGVIVLLVVGFFIFSRSGSDQPVSREVVVDDDGALVVEVSGSSFKFSPAVINAEVGQTVRVVFKNTGGLHDFVIDELNVATKQINTGESETVEFTVTEAGEYAFYCSVPGHRAQGMEGVLVVK